MTSSTATAALKYAHQAGKLSHTIQDAKGESSSGVAVKAEFVTPQDAIIITADGGRLPGPPLAEAVRLNKLREEIGMGQEEDAITEGYAEGHEDKAEESREENGDVTPNSEHGSEHSETPQVHSKETRYSSKVWRGISAEGYASVADESSIPSSTLVRPKLVHKRRACHDFSNIVLCLVLDIPGCDSARCTIHKHRARDQQVMAASDPARS